MFFLYAIKNATIEIGVLLLWYPQATDYCWRITQNAYADDISAGCYSVDVSIFGYRKKIKSIFKY